MSKTEIKGKEILLNKTPYTLFTLFSDLRAFVASLPEDKKKDVKADESYIEVSVQGVTLGVRILEKEPYSRIVFVNTENSPISFTLQFLFVPVGLDSTLFHIELSIEMNMMMKMMIGSRLQEMVDKLSDQIESAVNSGVMPDIANDMKF